ncbi:deacylase [Psychromonas sp. MB-3u-54]|uniref:YbaK/EbsC family protein n=1 Tax=Psychromonas sp. MB-3u-54 TaxID=2058319 RepID=UPI000C345ABB|nr:YbaK/EbsC family protein [Psychromonas sp. MB-3u-54]PKH04147.1 deacylase [Psychromonas sp. MB-3u-54]
MGIAITLKAYFTNEKIHYDTVKHRRALTLLNSSRSAHLPAQEVAKAVLLQDDEGDYLMASVPANSRLSLIGVNNLTGKHYQLVSEYKLQELFPDCSPGAIPAMGAPYKVKMLIDDSLLASESVYIESGDHQNLLKLTHQEYNHLVANMLHGDIRGTHVGVPHFRERKSHDG